MSDPSPAEQAASSPAADPLRSFYAPSIDRGREAGADAPPPALLCIDLQGLDASPDQGIFADLPEASRAYYLDRLDRTVLPNVQKLQRAFRARGREVIHVRIQSLTQDGRDRSAQHKRLGLHAPPGSGAARFLSRVAPRHDEIVLSKTSSGAFESTPLEYVLRNLGVDSLVLVGVYTNECISTAARVASDLGFFVSVVSDACATVTPALQRTALATLENRYARIVDTETQLAEMEQVKVPSLERRTAARRRRVVLLGGGAFAAPGEKLTMAGQFDFAEQALESLASVFDPRDELLLVHGNGPQVGHMLARAESSLGSSYSIPLEVCVAESEGELGYVLQQTLRNVLARRVIDRSVVSVLTQTVVADDDPAFGSPSKPIGPVCDRDQARVLRDEGYALRETQEGWRRLVPSPEPREIVEIEVIESMLRMQTIVVAAGGGGIPVVRDESGRLVGRDAVVDKDLAGALLASALGADELVIVTSVPCVYLDYEGSGQRRLDHTTPTELACLSEEGHFGEGTMAPKVEAARRFSASGGRTIICDVDSLADALGEKAGTVVRPDPGSG